MRWTLSKHVFFGLLPYVNWIPSKTFPLLGSFHGKISNQTFPFFMPWKFHIHSHSLPHQSIPHKRGQTWLQKNAHERENECLRRRRRQIIEKTCCISSERNFHFQAQLSGVRRHSLTRSCFYNLLLFLLCCCWCFCCYFFALHNQESEQSRVQNDHTGWMGLSTRGVSRDMKNNIRTSTLSSLGGRSEHWRGLRLILINFSLKLFSLQLNPLQSVFIQLSSSESAMNYEHLNYFLITMFNNIWNSNSCVWVYTRRFIHVKRWNVEGKWAEPREWQSRRTTIWDEGREIIPCFHRCNGNKHSVKPYKSFCTDSKWWCGRKL